jgi:hypothetical protein
METYQTDNPIDVVILWVDGNDPVLAAKRNHYLMEEGITGSHPGALSTRFASKNEVRYCVLSILKFAPFVRNIFIVTDDQDPDLSGEVTRWFPEKSGTLKIIDHKELFRGYEEYLPTFNSSSIHTLVWRIDGLSENFVFFNDDFFLIREIAPDEWFVNRRPVLRGKWLFPPYKKIVGDFFKILINRKLRKNKGYQPRISFYIRQWQTAALAGVRGRYFFHCHTPHPLNRRILEEYFAKNTDLLKKNISYRFRSADQFLLSSLAYHLEILDGNRQFAKLNLGYLHPYYSGKRLQSKMRRCDSDSRIKSVCAQSLDMLSLGEQKMIFDWMDKVLDLHAVR